MEAALTLAKRGFNTVLFEEQDKLGGTANLAAIHPNEQHTPEVPLVSEVPLVCGQKKDPPGSFFIEQHTPEVPLAAQASSPAQISVGFPPSFMPIATSATRTTTWIAIAGIVPSTPNATL